MLVMRTNNIEIEMKIPIPVDRKDGNGVFFSKKCLNGFKSIDSPVPLIFKGRGIDGIVVGVINSVELDDNNVSKCKGILFAGGFDLSVEMNDSNEVCSVEISDVGFCEE